MTHKGRVKGTGDRKVCGDGYYEKNDALVPGNHGLSDCELTIACRTSYIINHYKFNDEISHRAAPRDFVQIYNNSAGELTFREALLVYLRDIDRVSENEILENMRNNAANYGDTRKQTKGKRYNSQGRNGHIQTFSRQTSRSTVSNSCDEEADNDGNPEGDWDYQYQRGRPLSQACNAGQDTSIE